MKVAIKFYYTDTAFKIIKKKVDEGLIKLTKNKYFDVSDIKPELYNFKTIKLFNKTLPCFILHHKYSKAFQIKIKPQEVTKKQKAKTLITGSFRDWKELRKNSQERIIHVLKPLNYEIEKPDLIDPENPAQKGMKGAVSPENYKDMLTQGAMTSLLDVKSLMSKDILLYILIGAAMGVMMGLLIYPAMYML